MKRVIGLSLSIILFCVVSMIMDTANRRTDEYIRDRVYMLEGNNAHCSAVAVKAPSGKAYVMSAGHCSGLAIDGKIKAISESGESKLLKVIEVDLIHDLLLLEGFDSKTIQIAKKDHLHEKIHTITHGGAMPSYRTDGELLNDQEINTADNISSEADLLACKVAGREIAANFEGLICVKTSVITMSTAKVVPGSSGGPVLDDQGKLVGIVSATQEFFSAFVPLSEIQRILKNR